jgi:hypothetical protein
MAKQTTTRASAPKAAPAKGSKALEQQAEESLDIRSARREADDTARKQYAKRNGANLFPEVKPEDGQIVLAYKAKRVGASTFEAQYRTTSTESPDGAFFSNRDGSFSMFEGAVDAWSELPS